MVAFCKRYPDWPDNVERETVNGPIRWGREPFLHIARKMIKTVLAFKPFEVALFVFASLLEDLAPNSRALDRVYRWLLGVSILRGYRRGLIRYRVEAERETSGAQRVVAEPRS